MLVRAQMEEWVIDEESGKVTSYPGDQTVVAEEEHDRAEAVPSSSVAKDSTQGGEDDDEGNEYEDASFENEEEPSPREITDATSQDKLDSSLIAQQAKREARKERLQSSVGAKTIEAMRNKGAQINRSATSRGSSTTRMSSHANVSTGKAPQKPWTKMVMMMLPLSEACMQALIDASKATLQPNTTAVTAPMSGLRTNKQNSIAPQSFIHLLPDHSRKRVDVSSQESAARELRYRYMLVRDPTYEVGPSSKGDLEESRARTFAPSNHTKAAAPNVSQSFYLVQVSSSSPKRTAVTDCEDTGEGCHNKSDKMKDLVEELSTLSPSSPRFTEVAHDLDDEVICTTIAARCPSFGYGLGSDAVVGKGSCTGTKDKKESTGKVEPDDDMASLSSKASRSKSTASLTTVTSQGTNSADGATVSSATMKSGVSSSKKPPRKWDEAILGSVCRWRSCLCEAEVYNTSSKTGITPASAAINGNSNSRFLCRYHASLCKFLDDRAADSASASGVSSKKGKAEKGTGNKVETESESAKYLPRSTPPLASDKASLSEAKRDLLVIRATSSLLQELWDGKLKATLRTFTKKVIAEMGLRKRMEMFANSIFGRLGPRDQKLLFGIAKGTIVLPRPWEDLEALNRPAIADTIDTDKMDRKSAAAVAKEAKSKRLEKIQTTKEAMALLNRLGPDLEVLLRNGVATGPPPPPSWAYWKDSETLTRVLTFQTTVHTALEGIMRAEVAITQELEKLAELRVFPSNELQIIKKEVKAFKAAHDDIISKTTQLERAIQAQGGGGRGSGSPIKSTIIARKVQSETDDSVRALQHELMKLRNSDAYVSMVSDEYKLCERKLSILRSKRIDEAQGARKERKTAGKEETTRGRTTTRPCQLRIQMSENLRGFNCVNNRYKHMSEQCCKQCVQKQNL